MSAIQICEDKQKKKVTTTKNKMLDIKRDNAKFGKSIEHQVNKIDVKTLITRKQYLKYWSFRPTFKREKQFCNGAIAIETEKCIINLNEPLYIGKSILDLSKVLM